MVNIKCKIELYKIPNERNERSRLTHNSKGRFSVGVNKKRFSNFEPDKIQLKTENKSNEFLLLKATAMTSFLKEPASKII